MTYIFDIDKFVNDVLPPVWRNDFTRSWLKALLIPFLTLYNEFVATSIALDFRIKYSSQQKVLASLLNKLFDPSQNRIRVQTDSDELIDVVTYYESEGEPPIFTYYESEGKPPLYTYYGTEYDTNGGFTVYVPVSLAGNEAAIRAWVNYYKYASTKFKIVYE